MQALCLCKRLPISTPEHRPWKTAESIVIDGIPEGALIQPNPASGGDSIPSAKMLFSALKFCLGFSSGATANFSVLDP